jgi:predicted phosphodiesterase
LSEFWWRSAPELKAEYDKHGTIEKVSQAHGGKPSIKTLYIWWAKLELPEFARGPRALSVVPDEGDDWLIEALRKRKDSASVEELADAYDIAPRRVREALERLGAKGYRVGEEEQQVVLHRAPPPSDNVHKVLFRGKTLRFGVVSDTHLGSKGERLDELHHAYKIFADEGITTVYHPGDLVCGKGIFPGQLNEVNLHTYESQVDYAIANYPHVKGITTHIIAGNHDLEGEFGKVGANPVVATCNARPDMVYGGDYRATYELPQGTRIYMLHPKGGLSYALSYKVQKIAESFEGGSKPHLCLVGHYHRRGSFEWRNIQMLLSGCFEGGGSFGARLGLGEPAVGFHTIEMTVADDGSIVKFLPRWWKFFSARKAA